jgi:trehalose-6-phosphate synthase
MAFRRLEYHPTWVSSYDNGLESIEIQDCLTNISEWVWRVSQRVVVAKQRVVVAKQRVDIAEERNWKMLRKSNVNFWTESGKFNTSLVWVELVRCRLRSELFYVRIEGSLLNCTNFTPVWPTAAKKEQAYLRTSNCLLWAMLYALIASGLSLLMYMNSNLWPSWKVYG